MAETQTDSPAAKTDLPVLIGSGGVTIVAGNSTATMSGNGNLISCTSGPSYTMTYGWTDANGHTVFDRLRLLYSWRYGSAITPQREGITLESYKIGTNMVHIPRVVHESFRSVTVLYNDVDIPCGAIINGVAEGRVIKIERDV